jgi:hypothetical protein
MEDLEELAGHLARITRLPRTEAARAVREIVAFLCSETPEQFVVRRHRELRQGLALKNEAIYDQIAREVAGRPFAAPPLSTRQVRRLIYG